MEWTWCWIIYGDSPPEAVLEAIARKGLGHSSPRVRYIQIGGSVGSYRDPSRGDAAKLWHGDSGQRIWKCLNGTDSRGASANSLRRQQIGHSTRRYELCHFATLSHFGMSRARDAAGLSTLSDFGPPPLSDR